MTRLCRSRLWRGVLAALFSMVLLAQVQPVMACAYTDSRNLADCPCPTPPDPMPSAGCVDAALAPEAGGCGEISIGFAFRAEVRAAAAAEAPALVPSNGPLIFAAVTDIASAPAPLLDVSAPARAAVLSFSDTYLRTLRLRL